MPSSEPFETTIATLSIVLGPAVTRSSSVCVISDAPFRLRDAADLGGELRGALRKQLVELLDWHARLLAERADGRRAAGRQVPLAHELDHLPVAVGELADAVLGGDLLAEL